MKNYIIITLGTSEVQVLEDKLEENGFSISENKDRVIHTESGWSISVKANRNHKHTYLLNQPRIDGEKIIEFGIDKLLSILDFPLVLPAIKHFFENNIGKQIDKCLFVYTDQEDIKFRLTDTLHFATILKRKLELVYGFGEQIFMDFPILESLTNIDFQYREFAKKCHQILETPMSGVGQVVLFSQGGIDQINQALTLQFIQAYRHKLKLYQKAEGAEPIILEFPKLFLNDLNKQKIFEHLEKYNFGLIDSYLTANPIIKNLSLYANNRLELKHDQLKNSYDNLIGKASLQGLFRNNVLTLPKDEMTKLTDLFLSAKIAYRQKKINEMLWKLFTLNENLLKVKVDILLGTSMDKFYVGSQSKDVENQPMVDFLNEKNPKFVETLNEKNIWLNNPSRFIYLALLGVLIQEGQSELSSFVNIAESLEKLAQQRNTLAHKLGSTDINAINAKLGINIDVLFSKLDSILEIEDFGIYDSIKSAITNQLTE